VVKGIREWVRFSGPGWGIVAPLFFAVCIGFVIVMLLLA